MATQKKVWAIAIFGLILVQFSGFSFADNQILWMEAEFPPGYIQNGPFKGQGYEDIITDLLQEQMPDAVHKRIVCNLSRMIHEFQQGKQVCNVALYKTPEREKFMYFSIPSTFTFPNRLIVLKDKLQELGHPNSISLADLLKKGVKLGISQDRSYSVSIDSILAAYKDSGTVFSHSGKDVFESLLKMLLMGRLDCILGLPEEAIYVAEQIGAKDRIATISIKETDEKYETWLGYVAASKTDWGKHFIETINRILMQQRQNPKYRGAYERWLDDSSIESYRKLYDEVFLKFND